MVTLVNGNVRSRVSESLPSDPSPALALWHYVAVPCLASAAHDGHGGAVPASSEPEDFVSRFADFWAEPSPQRLPELLHPDVVLVQPLAPRMVGIQAAQTQFQRFWYVLPDLRAHVDHWCGDRDLVFIEFRLHARIGGNSIEWPNVNRLQLRDGKAIERITYFDPLAILPTLARHPSLWWRWWRSNRSRPRA
jgi:ketosteroid isomerase-like protein